MTALRPEPQTLLTVTAGMSSGTPPPMAAWRAGACPSPAVTTLPMMTSSISPVGISPARSIAARITRAPSSVAERGESAPKKRPVDYAPR